MKIEILDPPPPDLLAALVGLVDNICPFPGCLRVPSRLVELREGWRGRPTMENSLPLCSSHAEQAGKGEIESNLLNTIRNLLRPTRVPKSGRGAQEITARADYLATIRDRIDQGTSSLRAVYVGPLPLHPDWYFTLRDAATGLPNMDKTVAAALADPGCETFVIYRNNERYLQKIREILPQELLPALVVSIVERIDQLYGPSMNNRLVCADTGVFHLPVIIDNAVISAYRATPETPVGGGLLVTDPDQVRWERDAFDRIFAAYSINSQVPHVELAKQFVSGMLG